MEPSLPKGSWELPEGKGQLTDKTKPAEPQFGGTIGASPDCKSAAAHILWPCVDPTKARW